MEGKGLRTLVAAVFILLAAAGWSRGVGGTPPDFRRSVQVIVPASDGSGDIYIGGDFISHQGHRVHHIARLNSDCSIDAAFAIGSGFNQHVFAIAPAGDGSGDIYVGGLFKGYNGTAVNQIVRLNSDGTIDPAFAIGTGVNVHPGSTCYVFAIAPAGDGSGDIYVGGQFTNYNAAGVSMIVRLNSDGTIDTAFAIGAGFNGYVHTIAPAADGSGDIYVGGQFTTYDGTPVNHIACLNSDGTIDKAFLIGSGFDANVYSIVPAGDASGDIYATGHFTDYNGTFVREIAKLNSHGRIAGPRAIQTGFGLGVIAITAAADGSGDIYVGGSFTDYDGVPVKRIVRFNSDSTIDPAFAIGIGFNDAVRTIVPARDGSGDIYVGGSFTSYGTTTVDQIVRLGSDGALR